METPLSASFQDGAPSDERPVNPKLLIPRADATLYDVAQAVHKHWLTEPALTLLWLTPAAYGTAVADFGTNLTEKRRVAAERSPQVQRLIELDDDAADALPFLKGYLNEDAGSKAAAQAQYAAHGLVLVGKKQKTYGWAYDRNDRVAGVKMLLAKLPGTAYENRKYGKAFWQAWLAAYEPLVNQSGSGAGAVSHSVSRKDAARQTVSKALRAIIYLLKANYPDTFEAELRQWGFRKESY